jgi:RIP metalloprotease RseP
VRVPEVLPGATAAISAGIQAGDNILAVNGRSLPDAPNAMTALRDAIQASPAVTLDLTVERGGETFHLQATPERDGEGKGKIGVKLAPNVIRERAANPMAALTLGAEAYQNLVSLTVQGFWHLLSHFQENAKQVAGPVKIVEYGAAIARNDAGNLFQFAALISINLAIINILPLPALDGGQLAFLAIEGLQGKPLPRKVQDGIMQTGLFLLLGFGVFLIVRDTANLAVIQELFQ